jgi:hypothetical protein
MSGGYTFHVDLTSIMLFASALGETNKIYYDEEWAAETHLGEVIAPPTFPAASSHWDPNYGLRGVRKIPEPPPRKAEPEKPDDGAPGRRAGGLGRGLHGEQHYHYHRPVTPGMKLTVTSRPGKRWQKDGKRGGKLHFSETISEFRDDSGQLVVTARSVGIQTSKAVES